MPNHPEVLWAQRSSETDEAKNVIYFTVNLPDIIESTLEYNLTPTHISFKAKAGNASKGIEEKEYAFEFDLFAEVDPEHSSRRLNSRDFFIVLRKKEKKAEYWPRLTKEKIKTPFLKTDFSKWVDEDEQEGDDLKVDDDFDMGGMGGMGGMPGMGGMGGMPGMGGMGDMDFEKMMAEMGSGAGPSGSGAEEEGGESDSDDDGPPPLEEPAKAS
ncbi:HSP20-like chaperone [Gloeophyllum trabeum ATCC 11539]|uniref:HSP20-like chaperone n=1 Tax=Gloeophyllum trabeum (strain ATCC 11539 / FP-39264 / Madison 617) TaxID=670483 RepID=S7QNB0_GLOTA|nr:HSP20-like chaperone [Gloeophyllum trabeum ATCC 11539]EPQ60996.1 HSP20-like chaperone [Gloeophyllum trabeum ATCC 11539]